MGQEGDGTINISEVAKGIGGAEDYNQHKAKVGLAYRVLIGFFLLLLIQMALFAWGPAERQPQFEKLFDFIKTGGLPLATLVVSFYFRETNSGGE